MIILHLCSAHLLLSFKIDINFYNWKINIMHTDNAYFRYFWSNFLCSNICILCCSNYIEKLYHLSNNLSIRFAFDFQLKAFNYKQINALFSIALLKCIIMNIFVLMLLFYLVFYIVFHCCFVDLIHFFSNIEKFKFV